MTKWNRHLHQPVLPLGDDGRRVTASEKHISIARQAATEGMVLLKNENNALPLAAGTSIAIFGKACVDYVKGGGGSGDVTTPYVTSIVDGLREKENEGKINLFTELIDFYNEDIAKQREMGYEPGMTIEPQVPEDLLQAAAEFTDTAIITICRYSGEGWDRKAELSESDALWPDAVELAKRQNVVYPEGDFCLTTAERDMINKVRNNFAKIIVVLNIGGMMETKWFADDNKIDAALLAWQGGMEGGRAIADILCGDNYPSGKLSDTFAETLEDYPSTASFHESSDYASYTEDIYVGYRYFETIKGAADKVVYPFGFGLTYAQFGIEIVDATIDADVARISVNVSNKGDMPGKEVVQLYYSAPDGLLGKPAKELGAFVKTSEINPGDNEIVSLELNINNMASYDDLGKIQKSAWVLEKGVYKLLIGNNVSDAYLLALEYTVSEDTVVEQLSAKLVPSKLPERMISDGSYESLPMCEYEDIGNILERMPNSQVEGIAPLERYVPMRSLLHLEHRQFIEVAKGTMTIDEFINELSIDELIHLLGGQPNNGVSNTFGIGKLQEYGVPEILTADGPAGLRIRPEIGVKTTAWPCSTMLACTFNPTLIEEVGRAVALEIKENNIGVWLAPAMNIHRSPLCGRNFEYYSEDPVLSGKIGAGMVRGVQSQNIASTVKHFAFNNKETNRKNSDSRVSERAAREIYLRGFEIAVKESSPWCIMTSYNKVNGTWCSECKELIQGILRDEWGYDGLVMSDWWSTGEHYLETKAGNDLKMGNGYPQRVKEAFENGAISIEEIKKAAKNVLNLILKME